MPKKLLSKEMIVEEALNFIDDYGYEAFSLRGLSRRLSVQVSSLYNYINNEDGLMVEVVRRAVCMFTECIDNARGELFRDEAAFATADAFRSFVQEYPNLYEVIVNPKWANAPELKQVNEKFIRPIFVLLKQYGIEDGEEQVHMMRIIRVATHGFCSLEMVGAFGEDSASITQSYHLLSQSVVDLMNKYSKEKDG